MRESVETITSLPFKINPNELARATFWRAMSWRLLIVLVMPLAVLAYSLTQLLNLPSPIAVLIFVVSVPLTLSLASIRYRSRLTRQPNKLLFLTKRVSISPSEFTQTSEDGTNSTVKLSSIHKVKRMAPFTLVFITEAQAFFLPDGIFETPEDEKRFYELLKAGIGDQPCRAGLAYPR